MKHYFFSFNMDQHFKTIGTFNEVSHAHPIETIINWNKQIEDNKSQTFYTLLFFTEINTEQFDLYKANVKFI